MVCRLSRCLELYTSFRPIINLQTYVFVTLHFHDAEEVHHGPALILYDVDIVTWIKVLDHAGAESNRMEYYTCISHVLRHIHAEK